MSQSSKVDTPAVSQDEFREYLIFHAKKLSPQDVRVLAALLPEMRKNFPEVKTDAFPHTPERLMFLADLIEAFVAGRCEQLPFESIAEGAFALMYLEQEMDLIPDILPDIGLTDDATIVALVLERNAPAYRRFAEEAGKDWIALAVVERGGDPG
jgi:uncharacterized membrane protein YkvA (DUF1232 family)